MILLKSYNIIIDRGISAPGHGRDIVDGLYSKDKRLIFHMVATFQLPGSKRFDTQMEVHTATQNTDVILALEFQNKLVKLITQTWYYRSCKIKKGQVKKVDNQGESCST